MTAGEPTLTLTIRLSSSSRFDIGSCGSITPSSTIQHVKDLISQREESGMCASDRQRLIYKGRILSDDTRTLADYGIGTGNDNSGIVLYLVKGGSAAPNTNNTSGNAGANTTSSTNNSGPTPTTQPTNPNASMATNPFLNFGATNNANNPMASMMNSMMQNSGGRMPDLAAMQQEIQNNPQMMAEMMNNPMVQSLMNNTDFMTSMMENNPQMRQLMDSNPELRNALQDPELMRRSMEMMRDPSEMQNMMRNQDLAMANIENMPGGFNALRSMYQDVQEPMMDAMASGVSGTSGTGSTSNNSGNGGGNGTAGATNEAMPNPWGASSAPTANTASGTNQGAAAANPFASMMGSMGGGMPGAPGAANPFANPAMGANGPNIEQTLQMMENPIMRQMMDQMMSNPDNMRRMMESNPMLQQMRQTNPQVAAMFDNPDVMRSMMDPNNLRAMMQMQQSMQQLTGSMPPGMMSGNPWAAGGSNTTTAPPAAPAGGLDFSSLLGGGAAAPNAGGGASSTTAPMANPFMFPFMPPTGQQAMGGSTQQQEVPGQRFRMQLQNLHDMGFTDRSSNIRALTSSHGNVNRAIEILLESPPEMGGDSSEETNDGTADSGEGAAPSGNTDDNDAPENTEPKESGEKKND